MNKTYEIRNLPGEPDDTPKLEWHNAEEEPFEIFGLLKEKENGLFMCLPTDVAKNTSDRVFAMRDGTADTCHLSDLGFSRMASAIGNTLRQAFEITRPQ